MTILIISTRFKPLKGGVEEVIKNIKIHLEKKADVYVITSSINKKSSFSSIAREFFGVFHIEISSQKIVRFWFGWATSFMGYIILIPRFVIATIKFYKTIRSISPDVINYHFPDDSVFYVAFFCLFKIDNLIVNIHGNDLHFFSEKWPHKIAFKYVLNRARKIIVNSSYMSDSLLEKYKHFSVKKVAVIPNGIDHNFIDKIKAKKYFDDPYIFFVGRLVYKKGVDVLIRAFKKANFSDYKLLIEGNGEELRNIEELIKRLGLQNDIILTKQSLTDSEKFAYMKAANFAVLPSRNEPFGIVALEIMAAGVPLIASSTGGLLDFLVHQKNALLFENGNENDLVSKMLQLSEDPRLRSKLIVNANKTIRRFAWKNVSQNYFSVYKDCI